MADYPDEISRTQKALRHVRGIVPDDIPEKEGRTWAQNAKPETQPEPSDALRQRGLYKPLGSD